MAVQPQPEGAAQPPAVQPDRSPINVGAHGVVLHNLDEMWRFATMIAKSGLAPKSLQAPEAIMVAMQMGAEIGLPPMASMQNIAVINGRPSVWGDAMKGVCEASGLMVDFREERVGQPYNDDYGYCCFALRKGRKTGSSNTFTVADAKRANLWGKQGPWSQYPDRMLKYRSRSFTLRDEFPDVLRGLHSSEEVQDMPVETQYEDVPKPVASPGARSEALVDKIKAKPPREAPQEPPAPAADIPEAEPVAAPQEPQKEPEPPVEEPATELNKDLQWILAEMEKTGKNWKAVRGEIGDRWPDGLAVRASVKTYASDGDLKTIRALMGG